jgi:predicted metal-dependent hydrolase
MRPAASKRSAQYSNASASGVKGKDVRRGKRGYAKPETLSSYPMATRGDPTNQDTSGFEDAFQRGLALFNRGDYFSCHEVWEELWLRSAGDEKLFYQGMIQAAVAILHAERGNLRGAVSTWRKACAKLDAMPSHHMGIALTEFREALASFIANVHDREDLPPRPQIRLSE